MYCKDYLEHSFISPELFNPILASREFFFSSIIMIKDFSMEAAYQTIFYEIKHANFIAYNSLELGIFEIKKIKIF